MATFLYKGHEIYYTKEGAGEPILFIHGLGGNSINWLYQRNAFKQRYQVIAIDLPGHGKTADTSELTYHDYHKLLYHLLVEELDLQDLLVCGVSMGGRVTIDFAYYHQKFVKGIVLADTYAGFDEQEKLRQKEIFELMHHPEGPEQWMERVMDEMGFDPDSAVARGFNRGMLLNRLEFMYNLFVLGREYDQRQMLPSIRVPALILHGERDRFIPYSCAEDLHDGLVNSELVQVPGSGHLPNVEQPKVFNQLLEQFLEKIKF